MWLDTHTYHHSEFEDLEALCLAKQEKKLTISLCIPTLNEELTIRREVEVLKAELMTRFPLIDELAVIDSGSTDRTVELAEAAGADVYFSGDILPSYGYRMGKGENLWKSVFQLKGDIICFVDGDISNIHPRFVYGLVAPLIHRPEVHYCKAFYERPLTNAQGSRPTCGGRVSDILVRPLFSLFYPELAQFFQPLSGEYAVRREILEKLPFPISYGVETAHVLDVYHEYGLEAFAQTDLDQRVHRNQSTAALGKMSFAILQPFMSRLEAHGKASQHADFSNIYRTLQVNGAGYEEITTEIIEEERPPMIEIKEYLERFPRK